jgi:hypothetical protein
MEPRTIPRRRPVDYALDEEPDARLSGGLEAIALRNGTRQRQSRKIGGLDLPEKGPAYLEGLLLKR